MPAPAFPTSGALCDFDWREVVLAGTSPRKVSQWIDLTGNARHLVQATDSLRPWYLDESDPYNEMCRGVYFPFAYPNYLTYEQLRLEVPTASMSLNLKDSTVYFVASLVSDRSHLTNGYMPVCAFNNGSSWALPHGQVGTTGQLYNQLQCNTVGPRNSNFCLPSSTFVLCIRHNSSGSKNVTFSVNGIEQDITASLFNVTGTGLQVGTCTGFTNGRWYGAMKRLAVFNAAHDDATMRANVAWLMNEFGVEMRRVFFLRGDSHLQGGQPGQVMSWPYFTRWKRGDTVFCFSRGGKRMRDPAFGIGGEGSVYDEYDNTVGRVLTHYTGVSWQQITEVLHGAANDTTFIDPSGNTASGSANWINPTAQTYLGVDTVESIARQTTYVTGGSAVQRSVSRRIFDACQQSIAAGHQTYLITQPPRWSDQAASAWRFNGHTALNQILRASPESDRGILIDAGGDARFASGWPATYWETANFNIHPSETAQREIIAPMVERALGLGKRSPLIVLASHLKGRAA